VKIKWRVLMMLLLFGLLTLVLVLLRTGRLPILEKYFRD
jgi:hypothetical protein